MQRRRSDEGRGVVVGVIDEERRLRKDGLGTME